LYICISTLKHNQMIKEIKMRLLSYLFQDWVQREDSLDVLDHAKFMIEERESQLESEERIIIQGFKRYDN
jgi:hypothetical protein